MNKNLLLIFFHPCTYQKLFSIFVGIKVLIVTIYVLQLTVGILYHLLMNYIDLNQLSLITYIDRVTQIKPQVFYLSEIRASQCCHQVYLSLCTGIGCKATFPAWFLYQFLVHIKKFAKNKVIQNYIIPDNIFFSIRVSFTYIS